MVKFLHVADLHIGNKFINKNETVRNKLKKSLYGVLEKIVEFSLESDLDAIVIAGDLFDDETIGFVSENKIFSSFKKIIDSDIKIFYCTGNHDHFYRKNLYEKLKEEKNFFIFADSKIRRVNFISKSGEKVSVVGCGHENGNFNENMVRKYPVKLDNSITIGIAHTMVLSIEKEVSSEKYMPCSLKDLKEKSYDYFALGHIHKRMSLDEEKKIWYSGSPQGLNYKEVGFHGGNFVKIEKDNTFVEFIKLGNVVWKQMDISLDKSVSSIFDFTEIIEKKIIDMNFKKEESTILRINLSGETSLYRDIENDYEMEDILYDIAAKTGAFHIDMKIENLKPLIDFESYLDGNNVLSKISENLKETHDISELVKEFSSHEFMSRKYKKGNIEDIIRSKKDVIIRRMVKW